MRPRVLSRLCFYRVCDHAYFPNHVSPKYATTHTFQIMFLQRMRPRIVPRLHFYNVCDHAYFPNYVFTKYATTHTSRIMFRQRMRPRIFSRLHFCKVCDRAYFPTHSFTKYATTHIAYSYTESLEINKLNVLLISPLNVYTHLTKYVRKQQTTVPQTSRTNVCLHPFPSFRGG